MGRFFDPHPDGGHRFQHPLAVAGRRRVPHQFPVGVHERAFGGHVGDPGAGHQAFQRVVAICFAADGDASGARAVAGVVVQVVVGVNGFGFYGLERKGREEEQQDCGVHGLGWFGQGKGREDGMDGMAMAVAVIG